MEGKRKIRQSDHRKDFIKDYLPFCSRKRFIKGEADETDPGALRDCQEIM